MYYSFSADGAEVKRSRKHSLPGVAKSALPLESSSPKKSHIAQTFEHLAKFFFSTNREIPRPLKKTTVEIVGLFTCDSQSNEGGKFNP